MVADPKTVRLIFRRIGEFFRYMSDNKERRLYYVLPVNQQFPYAYQHSSIRDVATICDILDLVQFIQSNEVDFDLGSISLFETVTKNTVHAYHNHYAKGKLPDTPEGNIGDLGFFLLALQKCHAVFPSLLPEGWEATRSLLVDMLLERQNPDGSMDIFFDNSLKPYEKSGEPFYLPEALIGLIETLLNCERDLSEKVESLIQKAITYLCQDTIRDQHMTSDSSTFYTNWQFQLLYHWIKRYQNKSSGSFPIETVHLEKLISALKEQRIAKVIFSNNVATVEVACYLEGLVHAQKSLIMLNANTKANENWFSREVERSVKFLYEVQSQALKSFHGGFPHTLYSGEARVDVAGHVFGGLRLFL